MVMDMDEICPSQLPKYRWMVYVPEYGLVDFFEDKEDAEAYRRTLTVMNIMKEVKH